MKFVIALVALIGINVSGAPTFALEKDLLDFVELIPLEDIQIIAEKHLRNDKEFQGAIQYLQSEEFGEIAQNLDKTEEATAVKKYLLDAGIDVDFIIEIMQEILGEISIKSHHNTKSIKKFLEEVNTIIPYQKLLALYTEKLANSEFFQKFIDKMTSERFHKLVESLLATNEAQQAIDAIESIDVKLRNHIKMAYAFIGWKASLYL